MKKLLFLLLAGCATTQPARTVTVRPIPTEQLPRTYGQVVSVTIIDEPMVKTWATGLDRCGYHEGDPLSDCLPRSHSPANEVQSHEPR